MLNINSRTWFLGKSHSRSAEERRRRNNRPTACRKTWWRKCVPSDRGIYKDRPVRIIIVARRSDSPLRGRIHLRGLTFRPTSNLLQFDGGPYIKDFAAWQLLAAKLQASIFFLSCFKEK